MDDMNNNQKMIISFERGEDNKYRFVEVKKEDVSSENLIQVTPFLLNDISKKQNPVLSIPDKESVSSDVLYFDASEILASLRDSFRKNYPDRTDEELNAISEKFLTRSFNGIESIDLVQSDDSYAYHLNYRGEAMVVNENTGTTSVKYSNCITEIDMSKINPEDVIRKVKEKVIAQDKTVQTIVYNIYNNQKILESGNEDLYSSKANIILDGPTGTGKTFILKEVSKNLSIPINITPADIFAAPGYKGAQLEQMLIPLLDQTDGNIELAERGIVVLDEFDKLCAKGDNALEMHKAVQHSLLSYIGGTKISFEYRGKMIDFDTSKITFICLGAFTHLRERKIKEGLDENNQYTIKPEDYIEEGMERELVGRFSLLTATQSLDKDDMKRILLESTTSPIKNLQEIGKLYGKEITFEDKLTDRIAAEAVVSNTGARALQTIVNGLENEYLPVITNENADKNILINSASFDDYSEVYKRRYVK